MQVMRPVLLGLLLLLGLGLLWLVNTSGPVEKAGPPIDDSPSSEGSEEAQPALVARSPTGADPGTSHTDDDAQPEPSPESPPGEAAKSADIEDIVGDLKTGTKEGLAAATKKVVALDEEGVRKLVAAVVKACELQGQAPSWAYVAPYALRAAGEIAVRPVAEAIANERASFWALNAMMTMAARVDLGSAVPILIEHLRSESAKAQEVSAQVMEHVGPRRLEAIRDLAALLESDVQQVRLEAASALGEMGPAAALALDALERRIAVLGEGGGNEGKAFRDAYARIRGD